MVVVVAQANLDGAGVLPGDLTGLCAGVARTATQAEGVTL